MVKFCEFRILLQVEINVRTHIQYGVCILIVELCSRHVSKGGSICAYIHALMMIIYVVL